ncbi:SCO2523 family variant P-loop protein [Nocardia asteroides]|uniref:SCO2523 family variant P-loop protein n=1 Tax=Nocardia asteroides TaxID=1824 RepID=UPI001E41438A|nr:SCO2523 family variant P-loop protein [Nocardia asteroides]UGT61138.1 SCO2523 family variant P-loop protein [Nocardia asteroides]
MIVFSTSDKGGTGRSVTSCNIAYRLCAGGRSVAYLDFDFGSPTAGALFEIGGVEQGVPEKGLHSYLTHGSEPVARVDIRAATDRPALRNIRSRTGQLVLFPGDEGGAEFNGIDDETDAVVDRCITLLAALEQEFDVAVVDLSAGRSLAMELALRATASPHLSSATVRWLVFHRWTRQHILAASGLVHGHHGLLAGAALWGHDKKKFLENLRYVRTAVPRLNKSVDGVYRGAQAAWLTEQNAALKALAARHLIGATSLLGETPVEPVLQWREQVILDTDVANKIANLETAAAFDELTARLIDTEYWEQF